MYAGLHVWERDRCSLLGSRCARHGQCLRKPRRKTARANLIDPRMRVVGTRNGLLSRFSWMENPFYLPGIKVEFLLISRAEFSFAFRPVFVDDIITLMFSLLFLLPIALLQFFFHHLSCFYSSGPRASKTDFFHCVSFYAFSSYLINIL